MPETPVESGVVRAQAHPDQVIGHGDAPRVVAQRDSPVRPVFGSIRHMAWSAGTVASVARPTRSSAAHPGPQRCSYGREVFTVGAAGNFTQVSETGNVTDICSSYLPTDDRRGKRRPPALTGRRRA